MAKFVAIFLLVFTGLIFADGTLNTVGNIVDGRIDRGPEPVISVADREMSVSLEGADNMRITILRPNGRRVFRKRVSGDTTEFRLSRRVRGDVIVQVEASKLRFFSVRMSIE